MLRFIISVGLLLMATTTQAEDQCQQWTQQAAQAYKSKSQTTLQDLHQKIQHNADCIARDKTYIQLTLSRVLYADMAKRQIKGQARLDGLKAILNVMPTFWPALVDLGDDAEKNKQFNKASSFYNRALAAINDIDSTPRNLVPNETFIQTLYAKVDNARLASDLFVLSRSRGTADITTKTRGVAPRKRNIPIHFKSGQKTLKDSRYVKQLYRSLVNQGSPDISLIGHTDPKGNAKNNQRLSKQRANTIKQFLEQKNYTGDITTIGKGEDEPLASQYADPMAHYGKRRWYRMLRRVEIKNQ